MTKRIPRIWVVLVPVIIAAIQIHAFWVVSDEVAASAGWLMDDAFFYAVIAGHLVERGALEFYPGMETNGVQPLWMFAVAAAHWAVDAVTPVEWIRYLSAGAYLLFVALVMALMSRQAGEGRIAASLVAVFVLLQPDFQAWVLNGMETAVTLVVLVVTMMQTCRLASSDEGRSHFEWVVLALLGALCFFARTDLFVVSLILAVWVFREHGVGRQLAVFVGTSALLVTPYLAFNFIYFDRLVPLSGQAKQFYLSTYHGTLQSYFTSNEWRGLFHAFSVLVPVGRGGSGFVVELLLNALSALTMAIPVLAGYFALRSRECLGEYPTVTVLRWFAIIAGVHLFVMVFYHRGLRPYNDYYFAPTVIIGCIIVAIAVERWIQRLQEQHSAGNWRRLRLGAGVLLAAWIVVLGVQTVDAWRTDDHEHWSQRVTLAADLDEFAPADASVGAYWPGGLAYFSKHEVIPLDGIIASAEFQRDVMRNKEALQYLCEMENPYLVVLLRQGLSGLSQRDEPPEVEEWAWAFKAEMWTHGVEHFEVVSHRPVAGEESGWYLLRVDPC